MLQMPQPLDQRLFHSKAVIAKYNADVADFLQQQAAAEYCQSKNQKRNKRHDKSEY